MSMVLMLTDEISWGTDPVPGHDDAIRINLYDPPSHITVQVIFSGDHVIRLIKELSMVLDPEQRSALSETLELYNNIDSSAE